MNTQSEKVIKTTELTVERKKFCLSLCENHRGQFLRIVEQVGKNHNAVIVPTTGLSALIAAMSTFQASDSPHPPQASPPAASS
jgi:hypothetical protein